MNVTHRRVLIAAVLVFLSSCVVQSAPDNDVGFAEIKDINQLIGCYNNEGDRGDDGPKRYLSKILWPESKTPHEEIRTVRVQAHTVNSLMVTGESTDSVLQESIFVEGKDFNIHSGKIKITNDAFGALPAKSGEVFLGAGHQSVVLGLDQRGHGKLKETATLAGIAFLIVPIAGYTSEEIRFSKNTCAKIDEST